MNEELLLGQLDKLAREGVDRCLEDRGYVLFSGGVDSSILAKLVSEKVKPNHWTLLTVGVVDSQDTRQARCLISVSPSFSQLPVLIKEVSPEKIFHALDETKRMVSVQSLPQLEDCVAFYLICEQIRNETKEGGKLLLSANGPDELFCGYDRFRRIVDSAGYEATQREIIRSLRAADILRENVQIIARSFELKIVEPFFEEEFVNFCIKIPIELKILKGNDMLRKRIWRHYAQYLGISKQVAEKPKKAMQYSMGIHKILSPLIKKERSIIRP